MSARDLNELLRSPAPPVVLDVRNQNGVTDGKRTIPEETAVAFSYDGGTYAVMMATPQNLDDFALGFSLTEGIVSTPSDIRQLDVVAFETGIEMRMWLAEPHAAALSERRRHLSRETRGTEQLQKIGRPELEGACGNSVGAAGTSSKA